MSQPAADVPGSCPDMAAGAGRKRQRTERQVPEEELPPIYSGETDAHRPFFMQVVG